MSSPSYLNLAEELLRCSFPGRSLLECVPIAQPIGRGRIFRPVGKTAGMVKQLPDSGNFRSIVVWLWASRIAEALQDDDILELGDVFGHRVFKVNFALLDELEASDLKGVALGGVTCIEGKRHWTRTDVMSFVMLHIQNTLSGVTRPLEGTPKALYPPADA